MRNDVGLTSDEGDLSDVSIDGPNEADGKNNRPDDKR